jgi:nucleoside phosphorylase
MRHELRPLRRPLGLRRAREPGVFTGALGDRPVVAAITGIGVQAAARAAERILDAGGVERVVVVGIAGGIGADLRVGDVVVPEVVLDLDGGARWRPSPLGDVPPRGVLATSGALIGESARLLALRAQGVLAIDMETAAIAAVCERRGCPWSVWRALSDHVEHAPVDPAVLALAGPDGGPNLPALLRYLLARPARVRELARLARDMRTAAEAAAAAAVRALARG